jgi:16S rRNA (uracil1498-N3)-methyltransferase
LSRFFISPKSIKGNRALLTGAEAHHIRDVMRLKKGDKISAFDGTGLVYQGRIILTTKNKVEIEIKHMADQRPLSKVEISLVSAVPKKNKMDVIVQKCTEIGVDTIIPVQTRRTIVRLDNQRQVKRLKRWQRIAHEAAKQSGRVDIPEIKGLTLWKDVFFVLSDYDLKLLFCLNGKTHRLKDVLRRRNKAKRVAIFIGPEGDFTDEEVRLARGAGAVSVSLGEHVLKSDTACISALAMVNYELKDCR